MDTELTNKVDYVNSKFFEWKVNNIYSRHGNNQGKPVNELSFNYLNTLLTTPNLEKQLTDFEFDRIRIEIEKRIQYAQ